MRDYNVIFTGDKKWPYRVMLPDGLLTKFKWIKRFSKCRMPDTYMAPAYLAAHRVIGSKNYDFDNHFVMVFQERDHAEKIGYAYYDIALYIQLM